jgi:hypothetical protein
MLLAFIEAVKRQGLADMADLTTLASFLTAGGAKRSAPAILSLLCTHAPIKNSLDVMGWPISGSSGSSGSDGSDASINALCGDGDQSEVHSEAEMVPLRRHWSQGGTIFQVMLDEDAPEFAMRCWYGDLSSVNSLLARAEAEAASSPPGNPAAVVTRLLEHRVGSLRSSSLLLTLVGCANISSQPHIWKGRCPENMDHVGVAKVLLRKGARPDAVDAVGKTIVHYAAGALGQYPHVLGIAELAIQKHESQRSAAIRASASSPSLSPTAASSSSAVAGPRLVDFQDRMGQVAMIQSIQCYKDPAVLEFLCLTHGADPTIPTFDSQRMTPISMINPFIVPPGVQAILRRGQKRWAKEAAGHFACANCGERPVEGARSAVEGENSLPQRAFESADRRRSQPSSAHNKPHYNCAKSAHIINLTPKKSLPRKSHPRKSLGTTVLGSELLYLPYLTCTPLWEPIHPWC